MQRLAPISVASPSEVSSLGNGSEFGGNLLRPGIEG